jgi:transcriptional regulator with XRE-family HTH domain
MANRAMTEEEELRATEFRRRLAAAGLTLAEFSRKSGVTRNIVYRLTRGQKPKASDQEKIEAVLGRQSSTQRHLEAASEELP